MKFNAEKAKTSALQASLVIGGVVAGHALARKAPEKLAQYAPVALLAAGVLLPAVTDNKQLQSVALGVAAVGAISAVNRFTGPNDGSQVGIKGMIAQYVPQLAGVPDYSLSALPYYEPLPLPEARLLGVGEAYAAEAAPAQINGLSPELVGQSML